MNCSFLSWNTRGLGRPEKLRSVVSTMKECKVRVVFLQETKISVLKPGFKSRLCGQTFRGFEFSPSNGASGGLITLWDTDFFSIECQVIKDRFIVLVGTIVRLKLKCGLVNIYAPNDQVARVNFFDFLSDTISSIQVPVFVGGDFNTVKSREEKVGVVMDVRPMRVLSNFIHLNGLVDLPMSGNSFTWFRGGSQVTACKLDRFLVFAELLSIIPNLTQSALPRKLSDHSPVLLKEVTTMGGPRPFKWFTYWADDQQFNEMMEQTLSRNHKKGLGPKLRAVKVAVKSWVAEARSKETETVEMLEKKINDLEADLLSRRASTFNVGEAQTEIQNLKAKLWAKYRKDEREWLQKSRLKWFKDGDKNTKFFHITASLRNKTNYISCIRVKNEVLSDQHSISLAFEDHFRSSFNNLSTLPVIEFMGEFTKLSQGSAELLDTPFTIEEVWSSVFSADGNRVPGPDGFNLDFFKRYWNFLGSDIMKFFDSFYRGKLSDKSLNHSFITFIPKKAAPESFNDFRPISLVGSLYKILARVLARRLSKCLSEVIGDTQFAFIQGKQITDCALIANEIIEDIRQRKQTAVVFKADFQKAYDSVDWNFLDFILRKMGFGDRWRKWINMCLSTATISVLVNGTPSNTFSIKRGLRQGCPLSLFLFNIVGEALSKILKKATEIDLFKGVAVGKEVNRVELSVSHIQFVDDLIIFSDASVGSIQNIKRTLKVFEVASGLKLNLQKSKLYGVNVEPSTIKAWAEIF
ncbi:hypothetical protein GQ457_06G018130 [Hibiscus cannabinus]